jgi:hypothetical protein
MYAVLDSLDRTSNFTILTLACCVGNPSPPLPWRNSPQWARASSVSRLHDHTQTHHTRYDSSGRVIIPTQRSLLDNTQQQERDSHAPGAIRTRNPSSRAAADPRLRRRGQRDRRVSAIPVLRVRAVAPGFSSGF